jgi:hypothetical protein
MFALLGLLKTKLGGYLAIGLAALTAFSLALLKAFNAGKRSEQDRQKTAQLNAIKERKAVDEDIDRLSDRDARERLRSRWKR